MEFYTDEMYEILDEMNAGIEGLFNECQNSEALENLLPVLRKKSGEFIMDLEQEIEKMELIEMVV